MRQNKNEEVWRIANTAKGRDVRVGKGSGATSSRSLSTSARSRLSRIVAKKPEVMVKITGRTRGEQHLKKHLDYITRNGKLSLENKDGLVLTGRDNVRALHDDWLQDNAVLARGKNNLQAVQSVSIILSMPPGNPPDRVQEAARTWARETFSDRYDWLMARHDDKDHPHVHVTVRSVGNDGKRLRVEPKDLQVWRERFARELRRHGVEAEATPRQARGLVRKSDRIEIHKIEKRGKVPTARLRDADLAAKEAKTVAPRPAYGWETEIRQRQRAIQQAYLDRAELLNTGDDPADKQLARDIKRFVAEMPIATTRRAALASELREVSNERHEHERLRRTPNQPSQENLTETPSTKIDGPEIEDRDKRPTRRR
jgi:type IV secretion system T-DNA border endonuclease VirD2